MSRGNGTSGVARAWRRDHPAVDTSRKASSAIKPTEAQTQRAICDLLEVLGLVFTVSDAARVWSRNGKVVRSKVRRGWPDISMVLPDGRAAFLECKSRIGRLTADQAVMIQQLRESGAFVAVVRSLDDAIFELNGWLPTGSRPRQIFDRLHYQNGEVNA